VRRSGYQTNPSNQGGVQHSDAAAAANGLGARGGLLYSQIAASNALSSATEVVWNKVALIGAGTITVGCYVRYNAWGYYTVAVGTPSLQIISRLRDAAFTPIGLLSTLVIPATPAGVTLVNWRVESGFVCRVAGPTGTIYEEPGRNFYNSDNTLAIPTNLGLYVGLQTGFTVNTTVQNMVAMSAIWGVANPANQVVMTGSEVLIEYPATTS
jgi:hypothetical protein